MNMLLEHGYLRSVAVRPLSQLLRGFLQEGSKKPSLSWAETAAIKAVALHAIATTSRSNVVILTACLCNIA